METLTHIQKVKIENQTIKERVQAVLKWDDLQYGNFQAAMGELYLKTELDCSTELANELMRSKIYWSWWINHWVQRDKVFLYHNPCHQGHVTVAAYKLAHNPQAIVFKPHNTILRYSYAEMMGKLIDSKVNE